MCRCLFINAMNYLEFVKLWFVKMNGLFKGKILWILFFKVFIKVGTQIGSYSSTLLVIQTHIEDNG